MSEPARRGSGAIATIMSTITNILTLPFRLIGQLFGRRRGNARRR